MRPVVVVQRGLRTPTGPFFARFFIGIILGLVAEFAFMGQSTRVVLSSSAARWKSRKQIGGLKCRHGCSTGRHTLTPGFWQLNRMSASIPVCTENLNPEVVVMESAEDGERF
jgi:hypothetical protein